MSNELTPGPALDARVAEQVMGWQRCNPYKGTGFPPGVEFSIYNLTGIPEFSQDIAAAWQVVEALSARGWYYQLYKDFYSELPTARFEKGHITPALIVRNYLADTMPLAICRAALAAVESEATP